MSESHTVKFYQPRCVEIPEALEPHKPHSTSFWIDSDYPHSAEIESRNEDNEVIFRFHMDFTFLEDVYETMKRMRNRNMGDAAGE